MPQGRVLRVVHYLLEPKLLVFFLSFLVLISACVCRRPSWTPKTKPNGHFSMAGWFRFWCSTRLLISVKSAPTPVLRNMWMALYSAHNCKLRASGRATENHDPLHCFLRQIGHFLTDMSNRLEHQKRNQTVIEKWPFCFVFGVQLSLRQAWALCKTKKTNCK